MLLTVRHLYPSRAHSIFNCYHYWSSLVLQNGNWMASILHSRQGVMQGSPLAIITYRIGILPLIRNLKWEIPDVTQPQYADNAGVLCTFTRLENYFDSLIRQGPGQGYQPEPTKIILIVRLENLEAGKIDRGTSQIQGVHGRTLSWGLHWGQ